MRIIHWISHGLNMDMDYLIMDKQIIKFLFFAILVITPESSILANGTMQSLATKVNKTRIQMLDLSKKLKNVEETITTKAECASCALGIWLLRRIIHGGKTIEHVAKFTLDFCHQLKIQSLRVCRGIVERQGDLFEAIGVSSISASEMCTFFLQIPCHDERTDWSVNLSPKPNNDKQSFNPSVENASKLKILQISDTHWDPNYQEGANTHCQDVLCCRANSGKPKTHSAIAGRWGNYYKCDTPTVLFENVLKHIADTHKDIDYILWTGDLPSHAIWNQTREGTLNIIKATAALLATHFKGIPIYPAIGNHDTSPVDSFAPPSAPPRKNMSWLYDELVKEWSRWLPSETSKTIKRGAFYSTLVRPGLRIISVNGNYCSRYNFWLLKNSTDPTGQLAWLVRELEISEGKGEKVHIVGHLPPGHSDCIRVWSRNFYRIVNRFESTIMAQFYGHTHFDEYKIFYDINDTKRPINIAYISPSVSPWEKVNPAYRIYYVDGDYSNTSRMVVDHETWTMDLDQANRLGEPIWYKSYSARNLYNMTSLSPKDWDNLIKRKTNHQDLFIQYYRNYYRNSPVMPACDSQCKKNLLCDLKSGINDGRSFCKNL